MAEIAETSGHGRVGRLLRILIRKAQFVWSYTIVQSTGRGVRCRTSQVIGKRHAFRHARDLPVAVGRSRAAAVQQIARHDG